MPKAGKSLDGELAALKSPDEAVRERACRALLARVEAGESITAALGPLGAVLLHGSFLTWIAACHALRAAAARGAKLGAGAIKPALRLAAKPPKIGDKTLMLELQNAAAGVATHGWLVGNTWAINTLLRDQPELRPGVMLALREIAEHQGKLARPIVGAVVSMLESKTKPVAEDAARTLKAAAEAAPKHRKMVMAELAKSKGPGAKRLAAELAG